MRILKKRYTEKAYSEKETPWRSLVFTLLSARTRDEQTEVAYRKLCAAYDTPQKIARLVPRDIEPHLNTIGMYHTKAKHLVGLARILVARYNGKVPEDFDALVALPGVGRKTANCVMTYAFGKPAICADTHVQRVTNRLGWVAAKTPEKTEHALVAVVPKKWWPDLNRVMVQFGRTICRAPKPKCGECPVRQWCQYPHKNFNQDIT